MSDASHVFANLMLNVDPPGSFPKHIGGNWPLVIDAPMVEKMTSDKLFAQRLCGWKGPVLWTTGAMIAMAKNGSLTHHLPS
jgi:hypothetical protein